MEPFTGQREIISERRIADIPVYPLKYPPELSLRLKQSVIKGDEKEFKKPASRNS